MPKIVPKQLDAIVCSWGGAGSTMLCEFLQKHLAINSSCDEDSLKHLPLPPVSLNRNLKCVFVVCDPVETVVSLFRRGFHQLQSRKLRRHTVVGNAMSPDCTLGEYAERGEEMFGFEGVLENYYSRHILYPTLFLNYSSIWSELGRVQKFLGLTKEQMSQFPEQVERKSKRERLDEVSERMNSIYAGLNERLEAMGPACIRKPDREFSIPRMLITRNFYLACRNALKNRLYSSTDLYGE